MSHVEAMQPGECVELEVSHPNILDSNHKSKTGVLRRAFRSVCQLQKLINSPRRQQMRSSVSLLKWSLGMTSALRALSRQTHMVCQSSMVPHEYALALRALIYRMCGYCACARFDAQWTSFQVASDLQGPRCSHAEWTHQLNYLASIKCDSCTFINYMCWALASVQLAAYFRPLSSWSCAHQEERSSRGSLIEYKVPFEPMQIK